MILWFAALAGAAETWWVRDDAAAAQLAEATRTEWPAVEHRVVVGVRPSGEEGWTWDGQVISVLGDGAARSAEASDPHLAVLLARTWQIRTEEVVEVAFQARTAVPVPVAPVRPRWTFGLRGGTRTAFGEPFPLQGGRFAVTLEKGHVWSEIDAYVGFGIPIRGSFSVLGVDDGVQAVLYDFANVGFDLGWRGTGDHYGLVWAGPQVRGVRHWLYDDRLPVAEYVSTHGAMEIGAGYGLAGRRLRADLSGWARVTAGLPLTLGVQLDAGWMFVRARRFRG